MFEKSPGDVLDFKWDWSDFLGGDTISNVSWTVPPGLTMGSVSNTGSTATVWLSGGMANTEYPVVCQITTAGARIAQNTQQLNVVSL